MTADARLAAASRDGYVRRYGAAEWRAPIFADMVLDDLRRIGPHCSVVDIGCGSGFDGAPDLQAAIAARCRSYIGVEPDPDTRVAPLFTTVHRTLFEEAPIATASIDLAFGVMVVEHVADPRAFMAKVADVLKDRGVFWAFTIDVRHWSAWSSLLMEKTGLKTAYLNALHGRRGEERYANFPVHYRLNSPRSVMRHARDFSCIDVVNLARVGAEDDNLPRFARPINRVVDRVLALAGAPGSNLAFRLVRASRRPTSPPGDGGRRR